MDLFDFNQSLKPTVRMLELTGSWPKSNPPLKYKISTFLSLTILIAYTCTSTMAMFTDFQDSGSVIYALCIVLTAFHSSIKHAILNANKTKFFKLLDNLKDPLFTSHGRLNTYAAEKMRTFKRTQLGVWYCTTAFLALMIIGPVFAITERALPAPFPLDMKRQSTVVYLSTWFFQAVGTILAALVICNYNGLHVFLMGVAAAQLRILREKIIHSTDEVLADSTRSMVPNRDDDVVNNKLRSCVIHHIAIERYIESIEDMFMVPFLIQMLVDLIMIVFMGFNCVITPVTNPNFGRSFFLFLCPIVELAVFCTPGNEIIRQSEQIHDACYMSDWTNCGQSVRKALFIIMERSKRPLRLTAAKFVVLSLETFLTVSKSSFSYYTVLKQLYSNSGKM